MLGFKPSALAKSAIIVATLAITLVGCMDSSGRPAPAQNAVTTVDCGTNMGNVCTECGSGPGRIVCCLDPNNCRVIAAPLTPPTPPPGSPQGGVANPGQTAPPAAARH